MILFLALYAYQGRFEAGRHEPYVAPALRYVTPRKGGAGVPERRQIVAVDLDLMATPTS
jgi:hypothetical protein